MFVNELKSICIDWMLFKKSLLKKGAMKADKYADELNDEGRNLKLADERHEPMGACDANVMRGVVLNVEQ